MRVDFHPEAERELERARDWYERRVAGLGRRFFGEIDAAVRNVRESPDTWPTYLAGTRRYLVHRFPFALIYRRGDQIIQVVAVMHLKRRPGYWLKRKF